MRQIIMSINVPDKMADEIENSSKEGLTYVDYVHTLIESCIQSDMGKSVKVLRVQIFKV